MAARKLNWPLWAGLLLSVVAFISFPLVFVWWPSTRDFPWANLVLFLIAALLLFKGLLNSFDKDHSHPVRSRVKGVVVSVIGVAVFGLFVMMVFVASRQLPASTKAPQVGQKAPEFTLTDTNNQPVSLSELLKSPINGKAPNGVLLIFYRGYWCPACNSELRGIQQHLAEFEAAGVRPVAISVDSPETTTSLMRQAGYTFLFLADANNDAIKAYDLVHSGAGESGKDIARSAEFLVNPDGVVRWVNLTDSYWVRARPEKLVEVAKTLE
jgi:peroxiredoxin